MVTSFYKLKIAASWVFIVGGLTLAIIFFYDLGVQAITALINQDDYVYFDPKLPPVFLLLPTALAIDLFFICALFPFRSKMPKIAERFMLVFSIYTVSAFIMGSVLALVILIYPLSTHYYKCDSTSIISSGSHYARTKEMCKEQKKLRIEKFIGKESEQKNGSILRE